MALEKASFGSFLCFECDNSSHTLAKLYSLKLLKTGGYLCNYTVQIPSESSFLVNRVEYNLFPILQWSQRHSDKNWKEQKTHAGETKVQGHASRHAIPVVVGRDWEDFRVHLGKTKLLFSKRIDSWYMKWIFNGLFKWLQMNVKNMQIAIMVLLDKTGVQAQIGVE